ncbi:LON peptidase substrate-binding domain-containing protein [Zavarzinella formosa]|uniref:LON peptidase substrate-binding domain-containing protein n=1 Tax=Zavarzinella formosa TaxID=360055 RepID=UPI0006961DFB|nr:LON peptidase substrate-binding domain-containing protein [Zavarzinella formosa]
MMHADLPDPDQFDGVARLFPLPGLVFFPHTVQALHIFEPRYRQMAADTLATDKFIALVMLGDDWEEKYDHKPTIRPVACLGRVVADQLLPDGRYNLLLRGVSRVRIIEELDTDKLYRAARVEILPDNVPEDVTELMRLRTMLSEKMIPRFKDETVRTQVLALFKGELPLGHLCDVLAFALPMPPQQKQELLETTCVMTRARLLLAGFHGMVGEQLPVTPTPSGRKFPPDFSDN